MVRGDLGFSPCFGYENSRVAIYESVTCTEYLIYGYKIKDKSVVSRLKAYSIRFLSGLHICLQRNLCFRAQRIVLIISDKACASCLAILCLPLSNSFLTKILGLGFNLPYCFVMPPSSLLFLKARTFFLFLPISYRQDSSRLVTLTVNYVQSIDIIDTPSLDCLKLS